DCLRESCESPGRSWRGASERIRCARGGGRLALANYSPAFDRKLCPRAGRRRTWFVSGGVGPGSPGRTRAARRTTFSKYNAQRLGACVQPRPLTCHEHFVWALARLAQLAGGHPARVEIGRPRQLRIVGRAPIPRSPRDCRSGANTDPPEFRWTDSETFRECAEPRAGFRSASLAVSACRSSGADLFRCKEAD